MIPLRFLSRHTNYQFIIRQPEFVRLPDGQKDETKPILVANFGEEFGPEQVIDGAIDFAGGQMTAAEIRGGYLDTVTQQEERGWSDEDREYVEQRLLRALEKGNDEFRLWEDVAPTAPWPTYDKMHHNAIPPFAESAGMIEQALSYETRTKNRPELVAKLTNLLELQQGEATLTAA